MSLSVCVVTHYGSNESNDSFGFFCEGTLHAPRQLKVLLK